MGNRVTLSEKLRAAGGRPSGFDFMRITLAIAIIVWHTASTNYGVAYERLLWSSPLRPVLGLLLPMFFALSGFLVAGSFDRSKSIPGFLYLRVIRIFPALVVETIVSAMVIGPLFTDLPLRDYFEAPAFRAYALNTVGLIHYQLPAVFARNPFPDMVNGQLWTVPFELKCYIAVALFAFLRIHRNRIAFLIAVILIQIVMAQRALVYGEVSGPVPGNVLVLCFLAGFATSLFKDKVPMSWGCFALALAIHVVLYSVPLLDYWIAFPDAYITVFLGLLNPRKSALLQSGDYSYGIYLYGFSIQQAVAALGSWTHQWFVSLLIAGPIIALVAFLSWHGVEKHALRARHGLGFLDRALARIPLLRVLLATRTRDARPGAVLLVDPAVRDLRA